MAISQVLLLGNRQLYMRSVPVRRSELDGLPPLVADLHDTLMDFRQRYGARRAIAAPQIGVMKRLIYMHTAEPLALLNPEITWRSEEMMSIWDYRLCFPDLLVRVQRHRRCRVAFRDLEWRERELGRGRSLRIAAARV